MNAHLVTGGNVCGAVWARRSDRQSCHAPSALNTCSHGRRTPRRCRWRHGCLCRGCHPQPGRLRTAQPRLAAVPKDLERTLGQLPRIHLTQLALQLRAERHVRSNLRRSLEFPPTTQGSCIVTACKMDVHVGLFFYRSCFRVFVQRSAPLTCHMRARCALRWRSKELQTRAI